MLRRFLLLVLVIITLPAFAAQDIRSLASQVEAEGEAEIVFGDLEGARMRAFRNAIENAALMVSARVRSDSQMINGSLEVDYVRLSSSARLQGVQVLAEYEQNGRYVVLISAEAAQNQVCSTHVANEFRKTLAVTGFSVISPEQLTLGHLGPVDRIIASELSNRLNGKSSVQAFDAGSITLYESAETAPTRLDQRDALSMAVDAADRLGVQFVVSGVVRNMGTSRSGTEGLKGFFASDERHLVMDVYVHDGFSGALLAQSRYATRAPWTYARNAKVTFASPDFFGSAYGMAVDGLLTQLVDDLENTIACQPFMTSIAQVDGNRVILKSGAASGLRPGDYLGVYRTSQFYDRQQTAQTLITDTQVMAKVTQVQPNFAVAELPIQVQRLNVQADDLLIAW